MHGDDSKRTDVPTTRELQERMVAVNRRRKDVESWGVFRYPTSSKPVASVGRLEKRIEEFFSRYDDIVTTEDVPVGKGDEYKIVVRSTNLPTIGEFATFIGYPSANALYREMRKPAISTDPRYYFTLEKAVSLIEGLYEKRAMELGEKSHDYRAYTEILKRHDNMRERLEAQESATVGTINNSGGVINIYKGFEKDLDDRIDALLGECSRNVVAVIEPQGPSDLDDEEDDD